jgi:ring-1,2-phenylacetyl-CoA epoxidase subunit PaaE
MTEADKAGETGFRVKRGWMGLSISEIRDETADTKTFIFVDPETGGRAFDYRAGQYLTFRYDSIAAKPIVRSYTMSSAPVDGDFAAVTVKRVEGGVVSNWMCDTLKVGDVLRARGPIGKFVYEPQNDESKLVFVAAGSGVTPFLSIMKEYSAHREVTEVKDSSKPVELVLLVSFRTPGDIICAAELEELARRPGVRVQITLSRVPDNDLGALQHPTFGQIWKGRVTSDQLAAVCNDDFSATTFFTCGPEDLMQGVATFLKEQGVAEKNIKLESFAS